MQRSRIAKTVLKNKKKVEERSLPDFKTYYKAIIKYSTSIRIHIQINETEYRIQK